MPSGIVITINGTPVEVSPEDYQRLLMDRQLNSFAGIGFSIDPIYAFSNEPITEDIVVTMRPPVDHIPNEEITKEARRILASIEAASIEASKPLPVMHKKFKKSNTKPARKRLTPRRKLNLGK